MTTQPNDNGDYTRDSLLRFLEKAEIGQLTEREPGFHKGYLSPLLGHAKGMVNDEFPHSWIGPSGFGQEVLATLRAYRSTIERERARTRRFRRLFLITLLIAAILFVSEVNS